MDKKVLESIKRILEKNHLLTISTSDGKEPHSKTAFYTFDKNFNLYIWSEEGTRHSENLKKNNKVSINIFDSKQKWGSLLKGIQARGRAKLVNNKDLIEGGWLYLKRFPESLKMIKHPKNLHDKVFESKIYKIKLDEIKVFDEKAFGKGETRRISLSKNI